MPKQKKIRVKYTLCGIFDLEEVLPFVHIAHDKNTLTEKIYTVGPDTYKVRMDSSRYKLFKKSRVCVTCGLEGTFFRLEYNGTDPSTAHFNLYGKKNGKDIMLTKDHIIPRSKGGSNEQSNYQTMCEPCNAKKGNQLPEEFMNAKDLWHSVAGVVFEEETPAAKKTEVPVAATTITKVVEPVDAPSYAPVTYTDANNEIEPISGTELARSNPAYRTLKASIDFEKTKTYGLLQKYLAPMSVTNVAESTKYQIVIGQIKALEGKDPADLLTTFDNLKASLEAEKSAFEDFLTNSTKTKVEPLQAKIDQINESLASIRSQMEDLNSQLVTTSNEKADAEAKIAKARSQFTIAAQLISSEIEGDRVKYTNLLKV